MIFWSCSLYVYTTISMDRTHLAPMSIHLKHLTKTAQLFRRILCIKDKGHSVSLSTKATFRFTTKRPGSRSTSSCWKTRSRPRRRRSGLHLRVGPTVLQFRQKYLQATINAVREMMLLTPKSCIKADRCADAKIWILNQAKLSDVISRPNTSIREKLKRSS